ncbi:Dna2/Cas4 domain-containing protein, partial [Arthrospira platensis SPKY1]|nr:Dna2/Cas4 domain-containing protein [Arthrospira platensis SPKY1]
NECSILLPGGQVIKPDKVVLKNDGSWGVLEYKTGKPNSKHREQIELYAAMIQKMGHIVSSKIILYFQDSTIEVVELQ